MPNRIALVGKSGSGKSEVARILRSTGEINIIKTGSICRTISKLLLGDDDKRSTQLLDDALTKIDDSIFLKAALRNADLTSPFVIDSLRFASDLLVARSLNCIIIRVTARDEARVSRLESRGQAFNLATDGAHRSEIELDEFAADATIVNAGNIEELTADVEKAILAIG